MKKIFNKEIFLIISLFFFTLFVSVNKVNADTITITLPNNWEDIFTTPKFTSNPPYIDLTNIASNYYNNNSSSVSDKYFIYCNTSLSFCAVRYIKPSYSSNISSSIVSFYDAVNNSNVRFIQLGFNSTSYYTSMKYNSALTSLTSCSSSSCPQWTDNFYLSYNDTSLKFVVYSTFDIPIDNILSSSTFIFTDGTWTYTLTNPIHLPTLKELYDIKSASPPIPTDDYPLLTDFYSLCLDKFTFITEEFTSNYIYLAIITIFLLIIFIYFLKRRFL